MKVKLLLTFLFISVVSIAASSDINFSSKGISIPAIKKIQKNVFFIPVKIQKSSINTFQKLQKQESKLKHTLGLKDGLASKELFNIDDTHKTPAAEIRSLTTPPQSLNEFIPKLDPLITSLDFLNQAQSLQELYLKQWAGRISIVNKSGEGLRSKLPLANEKLYSLETASHFWEVRRLPDKWWL